MTTALDPVATFGSNLVAAPTPMNPDYSIDEAGFASMVQHLVATGCDGIVVAGTTGEAPTLTEDELARLIGIAKTTAAGRARIIAGVGTNDTLSSVRRARLAAHAGADALLVMTPYYSRPTQPGVIAHFHAVADATELPVMLYDVPHRTGLALAPSTIVELARHPRIVAIKDAKGDLAETMTVMAQCRIAVYSGSDGLNLPYLAIGAVGIVSVVGIIRSAENAALIAAVASRDLDTARAINASLIPASTALNSITTAPAATKVALARLGVIDRITVRPPVADATPDEIAQIDDALGVAVPQDVVASS